MSFLDDNSLVMTKTRELCEAISTDNEFQDLLNKVERFLDDDVARLSYQSVQQRGQELQQKQQVGLEISDREVHEFEAARQELYNNPVASQFIAAQQELETLQMTVNRYLGFTLENGSVPTPEDILAASSGCCGGAGGCGCH